MTDLGNLWNSTAAASKEKKEFDLIPKGVYLAKVTDAKLDSSNGKDFIQYEFTITDGEYKNRRIWDRRYFTEKTIPYIKREFEAVLGTFPQNMGDIPAALCEIYALGTLEIYVTVSPAKDSYPARNQSRINGVANLGKETADPFKETGFPN